MAWCSVSVICSSLPVSRCTCSRKSGDSVHSNRGVRSTAIATFEAKRTALAQWPNGAISGSYFLELPLPAHFEEAAEVLDEDDIAASIVCGPDPERHREAIQEYVDAGYDHVYVHQVGPDQGGFFEFYEREVLPSFN